MGTPAAAIGLNGIVCRGPSTSKGPRRKVGPNARLTGVKSGIAVAGAKPSTNGLPLLPTPITISRVR